MGQWIKRDHDGMMTWFDGAQIPPGHSPVNTIITDYDIFAPAAQERCECGTRAVRGQNHSFWCALYIKEM